MKYFWMLLLGSVLLFCNSSNDSNDNIEKNEIKFIPIENLEKLPEIFNPISWDIELTDKLLSKKLNPQTISNEEVNGLFLNNVHYDKVKVKDFLLKNAVKK